MAEQTNYLDPRFLSRLADLDLVARFAVEGFFAGLHPSPLHGFSVEYSDHRQYYPGDELKFVDWKVYGRTERLYIKQFQQETNTTVYILLDSSQSMSFADAGAVSKLDYGAYLAAALSYLTLKQCDSTSLLLFSDRIKQQVPPSSRRTHHRALLAALQANRAQGQTNLAGVLHAVAEMTKRRGLIVLITDLLDDKQDVFQGLAHLRFLRHDVILFQVLDHQELKLDYQGALEFEDLESSARLRCHAPSVRARYREQVEAFLDEVKKTSGMGGIGYCLCDTSQSLDRALVAYLAKRKKMM
jgi:uncharacterized protein (DUF58 family)